MADISTVLIAAISAGAGLAGSVIAGHFNLKALGLTHKRDDVATIGAKVEELYAELDRIQDAANQFSLRAMTAIHNKETEQPKIDTINLGKVRAIVGLYFPACLAPLGEFDARAAEHGKILRTDLKEKTLSPMEAACGYVLLECTSLVRLCGDMRGLLGAEAGVVGQSVRAGLAIPSTKR